MIRKAVIPAAGFGTRFLPATKVQPKEMLPIVDTPTIQIVVEEAVASGIEDILIITGKGKHAIEDHFDHSSLLENELEQRGRYQELEAMRRIADMANIHYIRQKEMKGLGDAIRHARRFVGTESFAVLLGDTLIDSSFPCTAQLIDVYEKYERPIIGVEEVPPEKVSRYGIISGRQIEDHIYQLDALIEKPDPETAPTNLAVGGRYLLTADIFDYLDQTQPGVGGEIQLTDALNTWAGKHKLYACRFEGKRHDIGNRLDYLKCTVEYALKREELKDEFRLFLVTLLADCMDG